MSEKTASSRDLNRFTNRIVESLGVNRSKAFAMARLELARRGISIEDKQEPRLGVEAGPTQVTPIDPQAAARTAIQTLPITGAGIGALAGGLPGAGIGGTAGSLVQGGLEEVLPEEVTGPQETLFSLIGGKEPTGSPLVNRALEEAATAGTAKGIQQLSRLRPLRNLANRVGRRSISGMAGELSGETKEAIKSIDEAAELADRQITAGIKGGLAQSAETFSDPGLKTSRIFGFFQDTMQDLERLTGLKFPGSRGKNFPLASEIGDRELSRARGRQTILRARENSLFNQTRELLPEDEFTVVTRAPNGQIASTAIVPMQGALDINEAVTTADEVIGIITPKLGLVPGPDELVETHTLRKVLQVASDIKRTAQEVVDPTTGASTFKMPWETLKENLTALNELDGSVQELKLLTREKALFRKLSSALRADRDASMSRDFPLAFGKMKQANAVTQDLQTNFSNKILKDFEKDPVTFLNAAEKDTNKMKFMRRLVGASGLEDLKANVMSRFFEKHMVPTENGYILNARSALEDWDTGELPGITKVLFQNSRQRKLIRDVLVAQSGIDPQLAFSGVTAAGIRGAGAVANIGAAAAGGTPLGPGTRAGGAVLSFLYGISGFTRRVLLDNERARIIQKMMKDPVKHTPRADTIKVLNAMRGFRVVVAITNPETGERQVIGTGVTPRKFDTRSPLVQQLENFKPIQSQATQENINVGLGAGS
jgi:hypothetical protein